MTPEQTIEASDETLKTYSEALADSTPEKASKWKKKIDYLLDARLEQMNLRDPETK